MSTFIIENSILRQYNWVSDTRQRVPNSAFNSFLASGDFLLLTFANILDQDQDRQNVGPDLDPNRLTPW